MLTSTSTTHQSGWPHMQNFARYSRIFWKYPCVGNKCCAHYAPWFFL